MDNEMISVTVENKVANAFFLVVGLGMIALAFITPTVGISELIYYLLIFSLIIFGLISIILCPRYHYSFRHNGILISVGYLNLIRIRLDRNKISHIGHITWNPIRQFGGTGIKKGFGKFAGYWCFNLFSGNGLEIKTTEKNYVIEMNESDRLRVLAILGDYPKARK